MSGLWLALALLVTMATASVLYWRHADAADADVRDSYRALTQIELVDDEQESASRNAQEYLLTGVPGFLTSYRSASRNVDIALGLLGVSGADDPYLRGHVAALRSEVTARRASFAAAAARRNAGFDTADLLNPPTLDADDAQMRGGLITLRTAERRVLSQRGFEARQATTALEVTMLGGSLLLLVIVAASAATILSELRRREAAEQALKSERAEITRLNVRLTRAMAETHHRVKNNLQVIAGLVEIESPEADGAARTEALRRIGHHVQTLAAIHDILTHEASRPTADGDLQRVGTKAAIDRLGPLLRTVVGGREVRFEIEDLALPIRHCTCVAVLINELVSNAVKHGAGEIVVGLARRGTTVALSVSDHGAGFRPGFRASEASSVGFELVESLARWDLRGDVEYSGANTGGARVTVTFPYPDDDARAMPAP